MIPRKSTALVLLITACVFLFNMCGNDDAPKEEGNSETNKVTFEQFAGSASCAGCHKDVFEKHRFTEHHLTSQPATSQAILGPFEKGENTFRFDAMNKVVMEKRDSGFYQVYYQNGGEANKGRFDLVIGSGRKGQSYLSWLGEHYLVQMPITYFTPAEHWSNSPGYPPAKIVYNRPITSRCLECHTTFAATIPGEQATPREAFDKNRIVLGVDCERCHGPGAQHISFQTKNPSVTEPRFIVNPGKLSRERQLDLCALCHGGQLAKTKPSFQFSAGDTLTNFFSLRNTIFSAGNIDVHGNQYGLLSLSKCFNKSAMTCTSCHSVHEKEFNQTAVFSQRCQNCHKQDKNKICKMTASLGPAITKNCIDCHMPKQPSHAVAVFLEGASTPTPALMRTHYIKIYPEEVKKVADWLKKQKPS
ncbi:hypothetical protein HRH25_11805 [Flavisolibacter sp. BT320]|nr:hypothetical protein [Flavisolibacter longurius]